MIVNVHDHREAWLFSEIESGEIFNTDANPTKYLMRTSSDEWAAVDIETGDLYRMEDFDLNNAIYYYVEVEVTIEK